MNLQKLLASKDVTLENISIHDPFWSAYQKLIREVVIPYQWEALNDSIPEAEPSHAIQNFRIAAGEAEGEFQGMVFQDSDVAKWLEAVGYLLAVKPDPALEQIADKVIDIIAKAQQEDGYLNTYFTLQEPGKKWSNLAECHELYCAGHMIEAAVAYYQGTGKRKLLDVACRLADHIGDVFGTEPGKIRGYDGHQEIELALVKLYRATGSHAYLALSQFFLDERGKQPHYYDTEYKKRGETRHWPMLDMIGDKSYSQAHLPVREQEKAAGHAVRFVYMLTAMADLAAETGDSELVNACRTLWRNMVERNMYITGGIGSQVYGESFSLDYDLPNDTVYGETCASVGLVFFAQRMLQLEAKSEYADVLERALYNTVIGGMSQDGKSFFYVNPLEVWPDAHGKNEKYHHVKPTRQRWFGCACCPPNIARLVSSLGGYVYTSNKRTLFTHLYVGGEAEVSFNDHKVRVVQKTQMPWEGEVSISVHSDEPVEFELALRIPWWCNDVQLTVNGNAVNAAELTQDGYAYINRTWKDGDCIELAFSMPILTIRANPLVRANAGKVALQRGPFVYCLEEADNGPNLQEVTLLRGGARSVRTDNSLLNGLRVITAEAERMSHEGWDGQLYRKDNEEQSEQITVKLIPYFAWANRNIGEMTVWVKEK